jgi:hypothetical protein
MTTAMTIQSVAAGAVAMLLTSGPASAQSGTSAYTPPPPPDHRPAPSGPPRSRMPLVDPSKVPPGLGQPNATPEGIPGATSGSPGQAGRSGEEQNPPTPNAR